MIKFLFLSVSFWLVIYFVSIVPDQKRLDLLQQRSENLQIEINKIDDNFRYLKAEREDLLNNDRFYIRKLSREKLRLVVPAAEADVKDNKKR